MAVKNVINLGSGSKGNAYFLEIKKQNINYSDKDTFGLLIECGFDFDTLSMRLRKLSKGRYNIKDIEVVLITHKHDDHSKCTPDMVKLGKRVYAPLEVFKKYNIDLKANKNAIVLHEKRLQTIVPKITVLPLPMRHDEKYNMLEAEKTKKRKKGEETYIDLASENESIVNFGYIISINKKYNILFFIDTMYFPYRLKGYKFNMIFGEANHFRIPNQIAYQQAKKSRDYGNIKRYQRVLYSHMSVERFVRVLNGLDLSECDTIFAMHTSTSERATGDEIRYYQAIRNGLKKDHKKGMRILVCKKDGSYATGGI